jgi:AcrR family transcriptional regulator
MSPRAFGDITGGRRVSLRERILEEAIQAVDAYGPDGLRVHEIARKVECSVSALYVHFGSREGLVETAMTERVRRLDGGSLEGLADRLDRCKSPRSARTLMAEYVATVGSPDQIPAVFARTELVARSRLRGEANGAVADVDDEVQKRLTEAILAAQQRGVMRSDVDAISAARLLRSLPLLHAVAAAEGVQGDRNWNRTVVTALDAALIA